MTFRLVLASGLLAAAVVCRAAEGSPPPEKPLSPKEAAKARMRAEGRKQPPPASPTPKPVAKADEPARKSAPASKKTDEKTARPDRTVLPQVEVRNSRITELDQQIAKQERDIAREKQTAKATEVDEALNDSKLAKVLSIFGGQSSEHREGIAQERISLMQAERDILEAIKHARTKAERAELQKQLDELRTVRRELEKSLR